MGTGCTMVAYLSSRLSVAIEVEVDADGSHACEGGQTLLLIVAIT